MSVRTELPETDRVAGDISQYLFDEFCGEYRFRFGGEEFELVGTDEVGLPDDPYGPLLVRRKRDGKLFEVELEAMVHEFKPPAPKADAPEEIAGQEALPMVTA